jgi:hypothetical protein
MTTPIFPQVDPATGLLTGFTDQQYAHAADVAEALNLKAPKDSPTFTGTPAAPTAAPGTNTTQLATTAFVKVAADAAAAGKATSTDLTNGLGGKVDNDGGIAGIYFSPTTPTNAALVAAGLTATPSARLLIVSLGQ